MVDQPPERGRTPQTVDSRTSGEHDAQPAYACRPPLARSAGPGGEEPPAASGTHRAPGTSEVIGVRHSVPFCLSAPPRRPLTCESRPTRERGPCFVAGDFTTAVIWSSVTDRWPPDRGMSPSRRSGARRTASAGGPAHAVSSWWSSIPRTPGRPPTWCRSPIAVPHSTGGACLRRTMACRVLRPAPDNAVFPPQVTGHVAGAWHVPGAAAHEGVRCLAQRQTGSPGWVQLRAGSRPCGLFTTPGAADPGEPDLMAEADVTAAPLDGARCGWTGKSTGSTA